MINRRPYEGPGSLSESAGDEAGVIDGEDADDDAVAELDDALAELYEESDEAPGVAESGGGPSRFQEIRYGGLSRYDAQETDPSGSAWLPRDTSDLHGRPPGRRWGYAASGWRFGSDSGPDEWSDSVHGAMSGARGRRQWPGLQSYAGQGPRNYHRSDDRIRNEVSDRLSDDIRVDATHISVQVQNGIVTLVGTVTSREHKRRAGDVADRISGVKDVINNVRVSSRTHAGSESVMSASST